MGLKEALQAFLDHRREVLVRRAQLPARQDRAAAAHPRWPADRLPQSRRGDPHRPLRGRAEGQADRAASRSTDVQADAILNTRLRQLAKLEEMELRREHADLSEERDGIQRHAGVRQEQWKLVGRGPARRAQGPGTSRPSDGAAVPLRPSRRRPTIDAAAAVEALVPREPITVILSERGLDPRRPRARRRSVGAEVQGGRQRSASCFPAETTDKLLLFASDGRFFTLAGDKLPSGRGQGEPLRLMIDLDDRVGILALFAHRAGRQAGAGLARPAMASFCRRTKRSSMRRAGKQVLLPGDKGAATASKRRATTSR